MEITDGLLLVWWCCAMLMLSCYHATIESDRRRSGLLPVAPLDVEYDNSSIDKKVWKKYRVMTHIHVLGCPDGWLVGCPEGCILGWLVGCPVGWLEGWPEGCPEGCPLGWLVGCPLGIPTHAMDSATESWYGGQGVHWFVGFPGVGIYFPAAQSTHTDEIIAPDVPVKFAGGAKYLPAAQSVHVWSPMTVLYLPETQAIQPVPAVDRPNPGEHIHAIWADGPVVAVEEVVYLYWNRGWEMVLLVWWMLMCDATVVAGVAGYDRRRTGLPLAPLDMEYDNSNIDKKSMKNI